MEIIVFIFIWIIVFFWVVIVFINGKVFFIKFGISGICENVGDDIGKRDEC